MKPKKTLFPLEPRKLYDFAELYKQGYRFGRLAINRELNVKNVNAKERSIEELKGVVSPIIVIPARMALENNLEVLDEKGEDVTLETVDLDNIYVPADGQHRTEAVKNILDKGGISITVDVMLLTIKNADIAKILQEVNNSVFVWNGIDWLTSLTTIAIDQKIPTHVINFVKELKTKPDMSDSAAWLWAKGEIISKSKITTLIKKGDSGSIKQMTDDTNIEMRRGLYEKTHTRLGGKLSGVKVIPTKLLSYHKQLIDNDVISSEAWEHIIQFVTDLDEDTVTKLQKAKVGDGHTKDQKITLILDKAWDAYFSELKLPKK